MFKHYITQVKDIQPFRDDLLADYNRFHDSIESDEPPTYVALNEDGSAYITIKTTHIIPANGVQTVAMLRMNEQQATWFENVSNHTAILARAKEQHIRTIDDCEQVAANWQGVYHSIFKQDPIDDGEGGFITPPEIHCVLV